MNLPAVKGIEAQYMVLVLNGSSTTAWSVLVEQVSPSPRMVRVAHAYEPKMHNELTGRLLRSWRGGIDRVCRRRQVENPRRTQGRVTLYAYMFRAVLPSRMTRETAPGVQSDQI